MYLKNNFLSELNEVINDLKKVKNKCIKIKNNLNNIFLKNLPNSEWFFADTVVW